jgi:hypothetical protein
MERTTSNATSRRPARPWPLFASLAILVLTLTAVPVAAGSGGQSDVAGARNATAAFHELSAADAAGYSALVADLAGITCIESADGGMGLHYLNPALASELFDAAAVPAIDASTPELLVYAPGPSGQVRLVALEYLTLKASWDATHAAPPVLFGQSFDETAAGNRYGLPAFYSLHAWVWNPNPTDLFAPYNPNVSCA